MRRLVFFWGLGAACVSALAVTAVQADDARDPVVIEFFTSQGCSSCPPADAIFARIAKRPEVVALALHVDYWDYLGWKDPFGHAAHTERQRAYAKAHKERTIYTPQIIVGGEDVLIGHDEEALLAEIGAHAAQPEPVELAVQSTGRAVRIALAPRDRPVEPSDIHLVEYLPERAMTVEGGENAGYTHDFVNIVTAWVTVARWDGRSPVELSHPVPPRDPAETELAVIVQAARHGPILAAATLD